MGEWCCQRLFCIAAVSILGVAGMGEWCCQRLLHEILSSQIQFVFLVQTLSYYYFGLLRMLIIVLGKIGTEFTCVHQFGIISCRFLTSKVSEPLGN